MLSFDVNALNRVAHPIELRILEAALFEDMCVLFNRGWALHEASGIKPLDKRELNEQAALRRAAVLASFYLVEAYLSSIAFDYLVDHASDPRTSDTDKITEWDHVKDKQRLVAFRDKVLHYPRIILGLPHPPLQENNCPEVKLLLTEAKQFRDAIVHANPRPDPPTLQHPSTPISSASTARRWLRKTAGTAR